MAPASSSHLKIKRTPSVAGAATALVLLTALNFVNYIDRYILPGVQEQVKGEFHVSDAQIGSLTFWFFLTYMLAAPATGWLGDRFPRKPLIVICALLISAINILTGTVHSFDSLMLRHAILGIGEASLGIYAPALLADFYPEADRNRILTIFYTAIPVGAALGYLIGELVGSHYGWRMPFYVSAVPGFLIAMFVLIWMREPPRGASDQIGTKKVLAKAHAISLATNAPYLYATLGMAMVTFSLGGISAWTQLPAAVGLLSVNRWLDARRDHRRHRPRRNGHRRMARPDMAAHQSWRALPHLRLVRAAHRAIRRRLLLRPTGDHAAHVGSRHVLHLPRHRPTQRRNRQRRPRGSTRDRHRHRALPHSRPRRHSIPAPHWHGQRPY
jgi:hypothetical protein